MIGLMPLLFYRHLQTQNICQYNTDQSYLPSKREMLSDRGHDSFVLDQFVQLILYSMPPKKDSKKEAQAKPDNSGIPKTDIQFKFRIAVRSQSQDPPQLAVMFEWFAGISDKFERNETPLLESWKKEEQEYVFEKDCDSIRVDDDFCKALSNRGFFIYFVNGEDSKVQDQLLVDYSSLLTANNPTQFRFESNIIRALGVDNFTITLMADKPLLEEAYRHYLNPLEVQVIGAKDLPVQKSSRYEPTYVKFSLFGSTEAETPSLVGGDKLLWSHKHVFLAGLMNPVELKEKMRSKYLKFQLHDRDEMVNRKAKPDVELFDIGKAIKEQLEKEKPVEEDPKKKGTKKQDKKEAKKEVKKDPKKKDVKLSQLIFPEKLEYQRNNYGVAAFSLIEFLKATTRSARYKAPVVPRNAYEDFESHNLDLNTTARNQMQGKIISSNNYFDCDTVLVVGFSLAHPIGTFTPPQQQPETVEDPKKKDSKEAVSEKKEVTQTKDTKPADVFERVVYIVPYKDAQMIKTIENIFYEANMKAMGLKNKREITTHLLAPHQQQSTTLDFVTGLEICDPEGRLFMIEGLRDGAIKKFGEDITRKTPNSKQFKILKNSSIRYSKRLFSIFHLQLKRIRLRPSLNQLLLSPSIYIKSKVPQQLSQTLVHLADARKVPDSLLSLEALNLWPDAESLLQIERKFSQPLSNEDISGTEQSPKQTFVQLAQTTKAIRLVQNTELNFVPSDDFFQPKLGEMEATVKASSPENTHKRLVMTKTFTKDNFNHPSPFTMRGKIADLPPGQEVYIYAGQKLNFYENQMNQFRNKMDPNAIYTYGKDYFRLSIDPRTEEEEKKKQLTQSLSNMYSQDKFSSVLVKTKEERMALPNKPGEQDILDMLNYPYHEQQARQKELIKDDRNLPVSPGKNQFKKYLKPQQIFSTFVPVEGEKVSPVEQDRIEREKNAKNKELEKSMLKGSDAMKFKRGYSGEHTYGVDRFKDIRDGEPKKIGLIDKHKREGKRRRIEDYEVSYNLKEKTVDPSFNPLIRKDDPSQNVIPNEFNFYQRPQVLTMTQVYKPLKDVI